MADAIVFVIVVVVIVVIFGIGFAQGWDDGADSLMEKYDCAVRLDEPQLGPNGVLITRRLVCEGYDAEVFKYD